MHWKTITTILALMPLALLFVSFVAVEALRVADAIRRGQQ
jgi:hypothetical protein